MQAIFYEQFRGPMAVREVPKPDPVPDGVVIKVGATGLCRSDWHGWMGHDPDIRLPHVPGHELAGIVEAAGKQVRNWQAGDRVTAPFAIGCGTCPQCAEGYHHICDHYFQPGFTAWGSFAGYVAIPHADVNLVRLPPELDFVEAASLGCRFTTSFRAVTVQGRVGPGQWLAVHGCGGVGLAAIMIASAFDAKVIAVDVKTEALELARSVGADYTIDARQTANVPKAIRDLTEGGAHVSLDALGSPQTCRNSVNSLRKRGRHVQVGLLLAEDRETVMPMSEVIARELEIVGSHGMPAHAFATMFERIRNGRLKPSQLVQKVISLADIPRELSLFGQFKNSGVVVARIS